MIDVRALEPGQVVRMPGDLLWEVLDNPRDGIWVIARQVDKTTVDVSVDAPDVQSEMLFGSEIVNVEPQ